MRADEVMVLMQPECEWSVNDASCLRPPFSLISITNSIASRLEILPGLYYNLAASAHNCRRQRASYDLSFSTFGFKSEINNELFVDKSWICSVLLCVFSRVQLSIPSL